VSDPRDVLQSMFSVTNRFANYGDVIVSMNIKGVRCHRDTTIEFESPITAFCGLNGTGKSTVLQLAAAGYRLGRTGGYRVDRFIVVNRLDPGVIHSGSKVQFRYWNEDRTCRQNTLSFRGYWDGYNDRPNRKVYFGGIGMYLPKSESPSFINKSRRLTVSSSAAFALRIKEWTCKILGFGYEAITSNATSVQTRAGNKVSSVQRDSVSYSEGSMGFGEARTLHLISMLETLPDKSLILIEEPETSLHLSAQHEFGNYLVNVCQHKRHQILITTHSEFILQALPTASRIFLDRQGTQVKPIPGLTSLQAKSFMADGHVKAIKILVEDETARAILAEIIRRHDARLLTSVGIYVGGDKDRIANTVRGLQGTGIPIAAVRDADKDGSTKENIFKLPGIAAPEKEVFNSSAFKKHMHDVYGLKLDDFTTTLQGVDHHDWFKRLAEKVQKSESALIWEAAKCYVHGLPENETSTLTALLKEASQLRIS